MFAEMNPSMYCITSWVAAVRRSASCRARPGCTVNTLISVTWSVCAVMVDMCLSFCQVPDIEHKCKVPVMQPSEAERSVGYLVKRVQQGLRRRCDAALKPI